MQTTELIIVFAALMALIALVTIGIDWLGKPLRNRRFIPRIYRFDDEKLPIDQYGNTTMFPDEQPQVVVPGAYVPAPIYPPYAMHPPYVDAAAGLQGPTSPQSPTSPEPAAAIERATQPPPRKVAEVIVAKATVAKATVTNRTVAEVSLGAAGAASAGAGAAGAAQAGSKSAFSDSLASTTGQSPAITPPVSPGPPASHEPSREWRPGMALDATTGDRKPNLATKAERFWMTTTKSESDSHFDDQDHQRMASGKAPRRRNPRTGRMETMQLDGLRQASRASQVRMRWPDSSIDPWSSA